MPNMAVDEPHKAANNPSQKQNKGNGKKNDKKSADGGDKTAPKSFRRSKARNNNRRRDRGTKRGPPGVKLILRLLPPTLTKDQFLETLKPVVGDLSSWQLLRWYYVQGYYTSKIFAEPVYSRCYFIFSNMDQLKHFAQLVEPLTFVDDKDNSAKAVLKLSSYCESYDDDNRKPSRSSEALEGSLDQDIFFQTFMNSMKLMEQSSEYSYADVNLLKPLEKEMNKQRELELAIQKRSESALVALAGDNKPKKSKKKKKKSQQKEVKEPKPKKNKTKKSKSGAQAGGKGSTTAPASDGKSGDNSNVVILEAAGKKELQRRKKVQDTDGKPTEKSKSSAKKNSKKPVKLLKKEPQE
ncbi:hypothetical protein ZYGR_0H00620 [Zygosaccharomyces rouxii]|uniref:ZYRO0B05412p n=2 Tax=Zygosaccharomyces rouxii TaxID=4956 RepID=C5DR43_ZYGRC|nr:uncharacterized protein ZYRO0B05412g [Zygosaccharomyces rouxii]KAH9200200.1 Smg-4/UPF3 family-domain-containing protein [Zygosaccharomyces rouxii]GAV47221.1 hypothetical protein ZYGR_0H00620 [Zygosaccharomyces rouxii]CAR26254.1 ZYRO0B05412p [Zygosaccharomyces rouxii]